MNIICVKLITGEDIIGRVVNESVEGDAITLTQTRVISLQEVNTPQGPRMAMALLPYLMGNHDAEITISLRKASITTYTATEPIEKSYIAQTSPIDTTTVQSKIQLS